MTAPLHLLRGFVQWNDWRTDEPIKTVDAAEDWVRYIAGCGFDRFYTSSSRTPRRADEMKGGSVYFVARSVTLFRMPFVEVEADGDGCAICMRPALLRVLPHRVGWVRGWRYLKNADAPPDAPTLDLAGDPPPEMARELKEMGLA